MIASTHSARISIQSRTIKVKYLSAEPNFSFRFGIKDLKSVRKSTSKVFQGLPKFSKKNESLACAVPLSALQVRILMSRCRSEWIHYFCDVIFLSEPVLIMVQDRDKIDLYILNQIDPTGSLAITIFSFELSSCHNVIHVKTRTTEHQLSIGS